MRKVEWELNLNSADSIHQCGVQVTNALITQHRKFKYFIDYVCQEIEIVAQRYFDNAEMDIRVRDGSAISPKIEVTYDPNLKIVYARGDDFVFVEFGAGVYFNGYSSEHPPVPDAPISLEMGSFGKGHGIQTTWGFKDDNKELVLTHGTPMQAPLYYACEHVVQEIYNIAKEVFG